MSGEGSTKDICLLGGHADLELLGMTMELPKVPSQ